MLQFQCFHYFLLTILTYWNMLVTRYIVSQHLFLGWVLGLIQFGNRPDSYGVCLSLPQWLPNGLRWVRKVWVFNLESGQSLVGLLWLAKTKWNQDEDWWRNRDRLADNSISGINRKRSNTLKGNYRPTGREGFVGKNWILQFCFHVRDYVLWHRFT